MNKYIDTLQCRTRLEVGEDSKIAAASLMDGKVRKEVVELTTKK